MTSLFFASQTRECETPKLGMSVSSASDSCRRSRRSEDAEVEKGNDEKRDEALEEEVSVFSLISEEVGISVSLKVMAVVVYYGSGCLFFMLGPEKWTLVETCYFLTVTLTTVGYGDVTPSHTVSQAVAIFFIFTGLVVIFPILASAAMVFVDLMQDGFDKFVKRRAVNISQTAFRLSLACFLILLPLVIGSVFFAWQEAHDGAWSPMDAIWWTIATVTTVGYGDLEFQHVFAARLFLIFFIPGAVVSVGAALQTLANAYHDHQKELREKQLLSTLNMDMIRSMDTNGDGVDRNEYILGMLQAMRLVDKSKIDLYSRQFDEYDVDQSGFLDADDLHLIEQKMKSGQINAL